jgi:hypothetical protein
MAPSVGTIEEIRRRVISEIVDLELPLTRRKVSRRKRVMRALRRQSARIPGLG